MCIISCFLQFRSFMLSQYRWAHEIYISTTFVDVVFFRLMATNQLMDIRILCTTKHMDSLVFCFHQTEIRYAFIVRWTSLSILKAFFLLCWMNLHFFSSLFSVGHTNISPFWLFCLCVLFNNGNGKNHLNFNGNEFVIFNQDMIWKLLKRHQIVRVNAS